MLAEYVWLGDLPVAEISGAGSSGGAGVITYIHTDHLGTPQRLTNSSGGLVSTFRWQPFGEMVGSGTGYRLRFPGQLADTETGLHDNGMRTYDPTLGRYLEADPIGLDGGLNRFAYVGGNPLKYVDPTGENPALALPLIGLGLGSLPVACALTPGCRPLVVPQPQPDMPKPLCNEREPETTQPEERERGLPTKGEPNSWKDHPHGKQSRKYGSDGNPEVDIDFGHDHGQGSPHAHNWEKGVRGPGVPTSALPKK
jgi:RHS repeat-associated protein